MSQQAFWLFLKMDKRNLFVQMALQCAPVLAGIKVSNLLIIEERYWKELCFLLRNSEMCEMPFPHELGLLLGYPAEDVRGFMGIGYKKCLYTGYWKVYEKAEEKIALFSEYDRAMDLALSMAYERQNILKLKEVFEVDSREKKLAV